MFSNRTRLERNATNAFWIKDYRRTINYLRTLNKEAPGNVQTLYMLALCHERLHADEEAISLAQEALSIDPDHFDTLQLIIQGLIKLDRDDEAVVFVEYALTVLPKLCPPWWVRALNALRPSSPVVRPDAELDAWCDWAQSFLKQHREQSTGHLKKT